MKKLIKIDTNGDNAHKYECNLELFDLITPKIECLIESDGNVNYNIDWNKTREYFTGNGHCIYEKGCGYIAAYEFDYMIVDISDWDAEWCSTLSELCYELAKHFNITTWKNKLY